MVEELCMVGKGTGNLKCFVVLIGLSVQSKSKSVCFILCWSSLFALNWFGLQADISCFSIETSGGS